jgi:uncharacterized protein
MILIIGLVFMGLSWWISSKLKSKFHYYSQFSLQNRMTGAEIAQRMLRDNNIYDVKITQVDGQLTDHYNPTDKTVNLSNDVYHGNSAASAAVAAHEVGHAVQHAMAYSALKMRSAMVPAVNIAANVMNFANMFLIFGFGYSYSQGSSFGGTILLVLVLANAALAAFALITLPVEFDASNRALKWMETRAVILPNEQAMAKDALKWAAMTYVVAAAGAVANLLYYLSMFLGRRDD